MDRGHRGRSAKTRVAPRLTIATGAFRFRAPAVPAVHVRHHRQAQRHSCTPAAAYRLAVERGPRPVVAPCRRLQLHRHTPRSLSIPSTRCSCCTRQAPPASPKAFMHTSGGLSSRRLRAGDRGGQNAALRAKSSQARGLWLSASPGVRCCWGRLSLPHTGSVRGWDVLFSISTPPRWRSRRAERRVAREIEPGARALVVGKSWTQSAQPGGGCDYWSAKPCATRSRFHQAVTAAGVDHNTVHRNQPSPLLTHALTDTLDPDAKRAARWRMRLLVGQTLRNPVAIPPGRHRRRCPWAARARSPALA